MRRSDAAAVAALTAELGYPAQQADIERRFAAIEPRHEARVFVAESPDGVLLGWIHAQGVSSLEHDARAEIWGLIVSDATRGSGVGRTLVEAAEQWAIARGMSVMSLRSNIIRTGARGFYEHLGYTVTKTQLAFRKDLARR